MLHKRIIILGCTGSIGQSTLDIVRQYPDFFSVAGLSAHSNVTALLKTAGDFQVKNIALSGRPVPGSDIPYQGPQGLLRMLEETEADLVVNGIAGSPGLLPSVTALKTGKDLALANKETIVMAGPLILELASRQGRRIIPVDSEHSALFHLTQKVNPAQIAEVILTASGGAFRDLTAEELQHVTLDDALKHPTWEMGTKITIDSATMANKGLEVIEASFLFSVPPANIKVLIHPQSQVHSLIRTIDGSLYAQISKPDMRVPIQNALTFPDLLPNRFGYLDLTSSKLTFSAADSRKYPLLFLAYKALEQGGAYPLVFNAANEVAVNAFIMERLSFTDIAGVVNAALERKWENLLSSLEQVITVDKMARETTTKLIQRG